MKQKLPELDSFRRAGKTNQVMSIVIKQQTDLTDAFIKKNIGNWGKLPLFIQKKIFSVETVRNNHDFGFAFNIKRFGKIIGTLNFSTNVSIEGDSDPKS